jgi:hypothetical protein
MTSHESRKIGSPRPVDLFMAGRFFAHVPFYLHRPLTLATARGILQKRFATRETSFLEQVRHAIYGHSLSPYRSLLEHAGCTYGDLEGAVKRDGIEATLRVLFRQGVYLSVDEFKGRKPVVRGSTSVEASPELLRNPLAAYHLPASSGGSRSRGTPIFMDLRFIRACAVNCALYLDARGGSHWLKATWEVPGAGARFRLIKFAGFGAPPVRWFSQVDPEAPGLNPIFRWNTLAMRWSSLLAAKPLPKATHAPVSAPDASAEWMADCLAQGQVPHLFTFPSSAVALCRRAMEKGLDIRGGRLTVGGEPTTSTRLAVIRQAGCDALPRYGSMECGPIGYGCMNPEHPDEVHLLHDLHALILAERDGAGAGFPPDAILITSLSPYSPFTLLNASMGDRGTLFTRSCGCRLEDLGWSAHICDIQSYEKLTGCGVTFLGADVIRVLEEVLPGRFGGVPTNYQMVEEESAEGRPTLKLFIHPAVGPLDPTEAANIFLSSLGADSATSRLMEMIWRDSQVIEVVRREPITTQAGKVLHLHTRRQKG